jgi:multidrug efflux pump
VLQFDLSRNIDGAARDVQAAIAAARADLPSTLKTNPTYRKMNPADAPIMILALTSPTRAPDQIYDAVSNIAAEAVAGAGRGQCGAGRRGAARVRIEINPMQLRAPASAWKTCAPRCNRPAPTARAAC